MSSRFPSQSTLALAGVLICAMATAGCIGSEPVASPASSPGEDADEPDFWVSNDWACSEPFGKHHIWEWTTPEPRPGTVQGSKPIPLPTNASLIILNRTGLESDGFGAMRFSVIADNGTTMWSSETVQPVDLHFGWVRFHDPGQGTWQFTWNGTHVGEPIGWTADVWTCDGHDGTVQELVDYTKEQNEGRDR